MSRAGYAKENRRRERRARRFIARDFPASWTIGWKTAVASNRGKKQTHMSRTDYMSQNDHVHSMHITDDSTAIAPHGPKDAPEEDSWLPRVTLLLTGQAFSLLGSSIVQYAI